MYRPKPATSYTRKSKVVSPLAHVSFKESYEKGLIEALAKAEAMRADGWQIHEGAGALMKTQAERLKQNFQTRGFEVELLPVAEWAGEDVVMLAYKAKPDQAPPTPTSTPPVSDSKHESVPLIDVEGAFIKEFNHDDTPRPEEMDNGIIINRSRIALFVPRTVTDSSRWHELVQDAKKAVATPDNIIDQKGRIAISRAVRKKDPVQNISFGSTNNRTKIHGANIRGVLRVLKGTIKVGALGKDSPVAFQNDDGDIVIVAPNIADELSVPYVDLRAAV